MEDTRARMDRVLAEARMFRRIQVCVYTFRKITLGSTTTEAHSFDLPFPPLFQFIHPTHQTHPKNTHNRTTNQAVRDSILVLAPPIVGGPDPLASLVSTERRLLKEGTLLKVGG